MYPHIDPYAEGMLDVGDGNLVHWDVAGNPTGRPAEKSAEGEVAESAKPKKATAPRKRKSA